MKKNDGLFLALRAVVAAVLLYSGFSKVLIPTAEFAAVMAEYRLLPTAWLTPFAFALPWVEIWIGLFLLAGLYTRLAAAAAAGLFTMFLGAIGLSFLRGIDLKDCGCFGAGQFSPQVTFGIDIVFVTICLVLINAYRTPRRYTLDEKLA